MKKLILIAVCLLILFPVPLLANTYYVDCDDNGDPGQTHTSITAALVTAGDGNHTINIKGTCSEKVSMDNSGAGIATPQIIQNWDDNVIIQPGPAGYGIEINRGDNYITIQASGGYDFTIQNFTQSCIRANSSDFIKVDGLTFTNCNSGNNGNHFDFLCDQQCDNTVFTNNTSSSSYEGVYKCKNCDGTETYPLKVNGNTIGDVGTSGTSFIIYFITNSRTGTDWIEIKDNVISGTYTGDIRGIQVYGESPGDNRVNEIDNVTISGNYLHETNVGGTGNNGVGIQMNGVNTGLVSGNYVDNWDEDCIEVGGGTASCYDVVVEHNFVRNCNGAAGGPASLIEIASSSGQGGYPIIIRNNVMVIDSLDVSNAVNGLGEHGTDNKQMEVYNNTCYVSINEAGHECYRFDSTANASLVFKNNVGYSMNSTIFDVNGTTAGNTISDYNSFYRVDNGNVVDRGGTTYTSAEIEAGDLNDDDADWDHEDNHVAGSPNFTDASGLDFSLQSGDDRIAAGTDLSAIGGYAQFDDGLIGTTWPNPTTTTRPAWDMGAYEYSSAASNTIQGVKINGGS